MTKVFTPKLYLFGHEYNEAIEHIFGKENIKMELITPTSSLADPIAEKLSEFADYRHGRVNHIVTVTGYENKQLTMLKLAGLDYMMFEVKTVDDQDTLSDWFDDYQTFLGWCDSGNDFLSSQETLLNNSESMFDDDYYGALYNTNFDLVDMKDRFEEVYREGFRRAFDNKFLLSN